MNRDLNQVKLWMVSLGEHFMKMTSEPERYPDFSETMIKAKQLNAWFTQENILFSLKAWGLALSEKNVIDWLNRYNGSLSKDYKPSTVGVINAGNIPFVGLHDLLCVLVSGNYYVGKNSSDDPFLLPFVCQKLTELNLELKHIVSFTDKLSKFDKVIATGSNNSARYFEYYFKQYPHIIRKNRNGVAVLTGNETSEELKLLGEDIFRYFGLGCRNVSHIMVPVGYDFTRLMDAMESYSYVASHHKYMNNYDYYRAILMLKKIPFYDNGYLILKQDEAIPSVISIVHYSYYQNEKSIKERLIANKENIQCVISSRHTPFGMSQFPNLWDYADGVDTLQFLLQKN
jgi:hypothetical protein